MRLIQSADVRLALFEDGDAVRPTLLLVHGYPDTHHVWDDVVPLLRDRFHVVRYDVRGAGSSTAPRDRSHYSFDHLAADMAAVLEAIGKPAVHLVGHDWGSIQSWEFLSRPGLRDRFASFTSFGGPGLDQAAYFMRNGRRKDAASQLMRSWYIGAFQVPGVPEMAWRAMLPDAMARDASNGLGLYRANMFNRLRTPSDPSVHVPVQLIETTKDIFVSPGLVGSLRQWAPRFWHRRIAAGHWAQRTHPGVIARMIGEFAEHIDGATPSRELRRAAVDGGPFQDRLVVVTGAGSGIGRATARAFAAHGAEVICADLDFEAAKATGGHPVRLDVADQEQMEDFARKIREEHGVPDIVVNNAGIAITGNFLDHSVDDWRRTLDVNLWGVVHGCRLFGRQMVERGEGGHIVNIASLAAFAPSRLLPAYSTSKAAVKMLSDCLRGELAGQGIGVSVICPGFVSTAIARNATYLDESQRNLAEKGLERRGYPPERVAAHVLRAVHRNQAVVPVNLEGHLGYALSRLSPAAMRGLARLTNPANGG